MQLLDLGSRYPGQIQTVAGRGGQPTLSHLTLTLARVEQAGQYECSPSNTEADTVTVHIVQGQYIMYAQVGLKMIALTLFLNLFFYCEAQGKGRAKGPLRKVTQRSFVV